MDIFTLEALLIDARSKYKAAKKEFYETDDSDAMHEMDTWAMTCSWLDAHIAKLQGK